MIWLRLFGGWLAGLPRWVWYGIAAILFCWWLYHKGVTDERARNEAKAAKVIEKIVYKQGKVTEKIVTKFQDRIVKVRVAGENIIKEVPIYVTPENDAACTINNGFVSLWNAANQNTVPEAATGSDAAASEVKLSDVAAQHATESKVCTETETKLESLQDWVDAQSKMK